MKFTLVYTKRAVRDIGDLDTLARKRLARRLEALAENPLGTSRKLMNTDLGSYRFRVGDYRVVFDIAGSQIVILRVGHRKEVYR